MQLMRHGYPTYRRAASLSLSRSIVTGHSQIDISISVQHGSSKGKAKAIDPDCDVEGSSPIATNSHAGRANSMEDQTATSSTASTVLNGEPSEDRPNSTLISTQAQKVRRRKRWRPDDSYPKHSQLAGGKFYQRFLAGPRLPPLTETLTEVILPEYAKEAIALRIERAAASKAPVKDTKELAEAQSDGDVRIQGSPSSKKSSRNRRSRSSKTSRIVLTPLPITHGFGDAEQRADRCRQAIQERDKNTRGVLKGLSGNRADDSVEERQSEVPEHDVSSRKQTAGSKAYSRAPATQAQHRPFSPLGNGILLDPFLISTSVKKYSILASNVRQLRRPPDEAFTSKPNFGIWHVSCLSDNVVVKSIPSTSPGPSRSDPSDIGGFTETWKGEEWRGEEWNDTWRSKYPSVPNNSSATASIDLGYLLKSSQGRRRLSRRIRNNFQSSQSQKPRVPNLLLDRLHEMIGTRKLDKDADGDESSDSSKRLRDLSPDMDVKILDRVLSNESSVPSSLSDPLEFGNRHQTSQSDPLLQEVTDSQLTSSRAFSQSHILAATRNIAKAGEVAPHLESIQWTSIEQACHTPWSNVHSAKELNPQVRRSSRKKLKAAVAAIRMKAKHELLSRKLAARYLPQDRKTIKSQRKQKKQVVLKDGVWGVLKPLAPGEQVLVDIPAPHTQRSISRLSHGLDRALFSQSVQWLQDPHSRVFNFPPSLQHLPSVTEFAFERLPPYVRSSKDEDLHTLALRHSKPFSGTTSSLTSFLSHIYFLVSGDRKVDISTLSMAFAKEARNFPPALRSPATFTLHHRRHTLNADRESIERFSDTDPAQPSNKASLYRSPLEATEDFSDSHSRTSNGIHDHIIGCPSSAVEDSSLPPHNLDPEPGTLISGSTSNTNQHFDTYAIDAGLSGPDSKRYNEQNVLMWLGTMTEKFLTLPEKEFNFLLRKNACPENTLENKREACRYSKSSKFVMRSQLDCQDSRLPGTGVFDIKTRAALPIRIDQLNFQANSGYLIRKMTGRLESFEREYYDLIRGAFLKYNFQARIGAMDGVFVAYHNTARMFGFQYVPVIEMEERLYGPGPPERGDRVFEKCVGLMEAVLAHIIQCFPRQSVSCTVDTREGAKDMMIWVTPLTSSPESPSIVEFVVTVSHTINGQSVSSCTAIDQAHADWELKYIVTRSCRPTTEVLAAFKESQARRFKQTLPEGMSEEEVIARLANVDWGAGLGLDLESEVPVALDEDTRREISSQKFTNPSKYLKNLRQLALEGKEEIKREEGTAARQVVWGRDPDLIVPLDSIVQESTKEQDSSASTLWSEVDSVDLHHVVPVTTVADDEATSYMHLHDSDIAADENVYVAYSADVESTVTDLGEKYKNASSLSVPPARGTAAPCRHG